MKDLNLVPMAEVRKVIRLILAETLAGTVTKFPEIKKELFTKEQLTALRDAYSKVKGIDPVSDSYDELIAWLDKMGKPLLKQVMDADIKFLSRLAANRLHR